MRRFVWFLALVFAAGGPFAALALPVYSIQEMPPLPDGERSAALAVNTSGLVVGWSRLLSPKMITRPCAWRNGVPEALPTASQPAHGIAYDVNDHGVAVGYDGSGTIAYAVKWENGAVVPLEAETVDSDAFGINNAGLIVGSIYDLWSTYGSAVAWRDGTRTRFGTPAIDGWGCGAVAVNNLGWVAGNTYRDWACRWTDKGYEVLPPVVFRAETGVKDINDQGWVVGYERAGSMHACVWRDEACTYLDNLQGYGSARADGIDSAGNIVGECWVGSPPGHAVLWRDGRAIDLNNALSAGSGWLLTDATDISDAGHIVGVGEHNGRQVGFLLTPVTNDMTWVRQALRIAAGLDHPTQPGLSLMDAVPDGKVDLADAVRLARQSAGLER